jgi:molecular chaperone DnaK
LKDAHKAEDLAGIDAAMETLNTAWSAASEHMYAGNPQEGATNEGAANEKQDDNVADAEFEEVK